MASASQQYYAKNRTRILAQVREYKARSALAVQQYNQKYYAKNRTRILAQQREYYKRRKRAAASDPELPIAGPELPTVASEPVDTEFYWEPKKETRGWLNWLESKFN